MEFRFQIIKNGAQMEVLYRDATTRVVPVKYHHELERSVRMIADSEEKLANSYLSLYPQDNPHEGLIQYFKKRGWAIVATPA